MLRSVQNLLQITLCIESRRKAQGKPQPRASPVSPEVRTSDVRGAVFAANMNMEKGQFNLVFAGGFSQAAIKDVNRKCSTSTSGGRLSVGGWSRGWGRWAGTPEPRSGCPSLREWATVCFDGPALFPPSTDSTFFFP